MSTHWTNSEGVRWLSKHFWNWSTYLLTNLEFAWSTKHHSRWCHAVSSFVVLVLPVLLSNTEAASPLLACRSPLNGILAVIDCTCCPLLEPRKQFSAGRSAHKFGKNAGVNYEVAQCLATGMIVWTNGPYPAGDYPDKDIFDRELILMLDEGERVLADSGYTGRDTYITVSNMCEQDPIK